LSTNPTLLKINTNTSQNNLNNKSIKQNLENIKVECAKNYEKIQGINLFKRLEQEIKLENEKHVKSNSLRKLNTSDIEKEKIERSASKIYSQFRNSIINTNEMKIGKQYY